MRIFKNNLKSIGNELRKSFYSNKHLFLYNGIPHQMSIFQISRFIKIFHFWPKQKANYLRTFLSNIRHIWSEYVSISYMWWFARFSTKRLKSTTFVKVTLFHGCFSRFLYCTNNTKSHKASHMWMKKPKWPNCFKEVILTINCTSQA